MTTPTPPAQDGERERLVNATKTAHALATKAMDDAWNLLTPEARTQAFYLGLYHHLNSGLIRMLSCSNSLGDMLRTQSAELAALRAQVEDWREVLSYYADPKNWRMNDGAVYNVLEMLPGGRGPAWKVAADALAPPQPVAKEK